MFNKNLQQLKIFFWELIQLQDTMLAVQQCDKLPAQEGASVRQNIILELIRRPAQIQDGAGMQKASSPKAGLQLVPKKRRQAGRAVGQPDDNSEGAPEI